ncbi:MAG: penicillin-binding protein 2, partial [Microcystaceae cyanobacterium]
MASSHLKSPGNSRPSRQPKVTKLKPVSAKTKTTPSTRDRKVKPTPLPKTRLLSVWVILLAGIFGLGYKLYQ